MNPMVARVLVTGASGGIGREVAATLARAGAGLLLAGRRQAPLRELARDLSHAGTVPDWLAGDLLDADYRDRLGDRCRERDINVVVHGAGINRPGMFEELDPVEVAALMETNVLAPMLLTRRLLPELRTQEESLLLFLGSGFGALAYPGFVAYSASKFALRGFAEGLRRELADSPVRVSLLVPRAVDTAMNGSAVRRMQARLGMRADPPERVAECVLALIRRPRAEVHMGWPDRLFFGINRLRPTLIDRGLRGNLTEIRRLLGNSP